MVSAVGQGDTGDGGKGRGRKGRRLRDMVSAVGQGDTGDGGEGKEGAPSEGHGFSSRSGGHWGWRGGEGMGAV